MRALVIRKRDFGESDLIVEFLCETGALHSGFAASAKRSRRRFPHQFFLPAIYKVEWTRSAQGGQLKRIASCELDQAFPKIADHLEDYARWSSLLEWMARSHNELGQNLNYFENLCAVLRASESHQFHSAYHRFLIEEMQRHGVHPDLKNCGSCHQAIYAESNFSIIEAKIFHMDCRPGWKMTVKARDFFCQVLTDESGAEDLPLLSTEDLQCLDATTLQFLTTQLGLELKSQNFLRQIAESSFPSARDLPASF